MTRIATVLTFGVLSVAAYKHYEAGHGKAGAQHALDLMKLAGLSTLDTISLPSCKNNCCYKNMRNWGIVLS